MSPVANCYPKAVRKYATIRKNILNGEKMAKGGRPRPLSRILREEWEAIPNTPENQDRRDKAWVRLSKQQDFEIRLYKLKKTEWALRRKQKKERERNAGIIVNPTSASRLVIDKALNKQGDTQE